MTNLAVKIEDFSFAYSDGTSALDKINLQIPHGERIALIGPNGAGKSTLLLAIGCFLHKQQSIEIDGIKNTKKNIKKIRRILGTLFQNPDEQLFMPRLFDDVAFGPLNMGLPKGEVVQRAQDALKTVGLFAMKDKEPHHLSAGQKRSAAIATILSMMPKIITMDEPDCNLDPRSRDNLVALLKKMSQTLIIATCNMNFVSQICDRVVLIDSGRIIIDGATKEILSNHDLMHKHGLEVPAMYL